MTSFIDVQRHVAAYRLSSCISGKLAGFKQNKVRKVADNEGSSIPSLVFYLLYIMLCVSMYLLCLIYLLLLFPQTFGFQLRDKDVNETKYNAFFLIFSLFNYNKQNNRNKN